MTRIAQLGAAAADDIVLDHEMPRVCCLAAAVLLVLVLPVLSSQQIKNSWRNCSGISDM